MYVEAVPNRNSPPAVLLRESFRDGATIRKRTLANLSHWPPRQVDLLRRVLKGEALVSPLQALQIVRSLPHGHVAAVLGTARRLGLERLLSRTPSRLRDLCLAMIVARLLEPCSKLATARLLAETTAQSSLGPTLGLGAIDENDLYAAMDWLLARQPHIEGELAKRHLGEGSLVLYDLTSTYLEGRACPLGRLGYSRDERRGNLQIVFGLLTTQEGCPVAVEVFEGNTGDPKTVAAQITKLRQRFGLQQVILVGDRGMLTQARIEQDLKKTPGIEWITALRAPQIQKLLADAALQLSLFDQRDLAEITQHPDYPGERLIACRNPLLAEERKHKREDLLAATEKELDKIVAATQRRRKPLRGRKDIGLAVGKVLGRYKVGKHFRLQIEDEGFSYQRNQTNIEREASLDGIYVIRTSVAAPALAADDAVRRYKSLAAVERAFRSLKSIDLKVRPIHHHLAARVRAHILLCTLTYYVEWHMRQALAPVLFDDHDKAAAEQQRVSIVAPAQRSAAAERKAHTKITEAGQPVHSFQSVLKNLRTIARNRVRMGEHEFEMLTSPTDLQQHIFDLLNLACQ